MKDLQERRDKNRLATKRWRERNPDYSSSYYQKNKERITLKNLNWHRDNPEKSKIIVHNHLINKRNRNIQWLLSYYNVPFIQCKKCGYSAFFGAIEGHHLDPKVKKHKEDTMSKWLNKPLHQFQDKIKTNNIIWLCNRCHRELHCNYWKIEEIL